MKIRKTLIGITAIFFFVSYLFMFCSKAGTGERGQGNLQVSLTDDPGNFDAVYIDLQDVQVNLSGNSDNGWQSLPGVRKGMYDLLSLAGGRDTIVAEGPIQSGRVYQLRLILGTENFVKIDSAMIRMNILPEQQGGLNLKIQQYVGTGSSLKVLLDFDVAESVVAIDSATYHLKPAIRTVFEFVGGSLSGLVRPNDFRTWVYAIQGPDTIASTFTGQDGGFLIKGIAEGSYSINFSPSDSLHRDTILTGINAVNKQEIVLDTMFLQQ
jgi:hypothetical protein